MDVQGWALVLTGVGMIATGLVCLGGFIWHTSKHSTTFKLGMEAMKSAVTDGFTTLKSELEKRDVQIDAQWKRHDQLKGRVIRLETKAGIEVDD